MTNFTLFVTTILFFLVFTTYSEPERQSKVFRKGQRYFDNANFWEAKQIFDELLMTNSRDIAINYYLGASKIALKDYEGALTNFRTIYDVSEGQPNELLDIYYLAYLYHTTHHFYEAIRMYHILISRMVKDDIEILYLPQKQTYLEINDLKRRIHQCRFAQDQIRNPIKVKITRLSDSINTIWPEFRPLISFNEHILIFTSRRPNNFNRYAPDGLPYEDIFITRRQANGEWKQAVPLDSGLVNTPDHNTAVTISNDGTTVFTSSTTFNFLRRQIGDLYFSNQINNQWTAPILLPDKINSDYWESDATTTADGQLLLFTSNRPGGHGQNDLYSSKFINGYWENAKNLGHIINTAFNEEAPYINADGSVLYFASEGHQSMGGFDIFSADYYDHYHKWKNIKNMGYPINTSADEKYFAWTADGSKAYFAVPRPETNYYSDLYMLELDRPRFNFITFEGHIYDDESHKPLAYIIRIYDLNKRNLVQEDKVNNQTGAYTFTLTPNKNYGAFIFFLEGYLFKSYNFHQTKQKHIY